MKNKFITVFMGMCLVLGLSACGNSQSNNTQNLEAETIETDEIETEAEEIEYEYSGSGDWDAEQEIADEYVSAIQDISENYENEFISYDIDPRLTDYDAYTMTLTRTGYNPSVTEVECVNNFYIQVDDVLLDIGKDITIDDIVNAFKSGSEADAYTFKLDTVGELTDYDASQSPEVGRTQKLCVVKNASEYFYMTIDVDSAPTVGECSIDLSQGLSMPILTMGAKNTYYTGGYQFYSDEYEGDEFGELGIVYSVYVPDSLQTIDGTDYMYYITIWENTAQNYSYLYDKEIKNQAFIVNRELKSVRYSYNDVQLTYEINK